MSTLVLWRVGSSKVCCRVGVYGVQLANLLERECRPLLSVELTAAKRVRVGVVVRK